ncbi:hypothetical protein BDY24DRAFT_33384 [Mrakia frigida]|uniref:uncharacterized protein n=1 Tax=Mrakia frigida TaxID=29902 RepID=UPI003FCC0267
MSCLRRSLRRFYQFLTPFACPVFRFLFFLSVGVCLDLSKGLSLPTSSTDSGMARRNNGRDRAKRRRVEGSPFVLLSLFRLGPLRYDIFVVLYGYA